MSKNRIIFYNLDNIKNTIDISLCIDYHLDFNRKCRGCRFFTGEKCHGHGDYHGSCKLVELFDSNYYNSICYDTSICLLKGKLFNKDGKIIYGKE